MSAPLSTSAAEALRHAEFMAEAAMRGETPHQAGMRRCWDAVKRNSKRSSPGAISWRLLSEDLRRLLLTMCTNRDKLDFVVHEPWESFTPDERLAMGSMARQWRRELDQAAGCLR